MVLRPLPRLPRMPRPSRSGAIVLLVCLLVATSIAGYLKVRSYVIARLGALPVRPTVMLKNQPVWMSAYLAQSIANSVRPASPSSPFDKQVLVDAYNALAINPWIKHVNEVRRVYGTSPGDRLEIDCVYRTPAALVQVGDQYTLVANDGAVLPEEFSANDLPRVMFTSATAGSHTQLRIIQGVTEHPTKVGAVWSGDDLAAGLRMANLLANLPFADDILRIDVSNVAGRQDARSPWIVLVTKANTQIRWGRPPGNDDFTEISPATKLVHLEQIYARYHRVDANEPWLDLRFDHVIYPTQQATVTASAQ